MATAITKIDTVSQFFKGQGDIFIFDAPTDYSTAKLSTLANPQSIGDVLQGSTSWTGEDITVNPIKNEQGVTVISTTEAGTLGFEMTAMSVSTKMIQKFLRGSVITDTFATGSLVPSGSTEVGFGTELPVIECPIAITNETLDKTLIFPKASIASTFTMTDGIMGIAMSVTAELIDTATLKTAMILDGKLNYSTT